MTMVFTKISPNIQIIALEHKGLVYAPFSKVLRPNLVGSNLLDDLGVLSGRSPSYQHCHTQLTGITVPSGTVK